MKANPKDMSTCKCSANIENRHEKTCPHWHDPVEHPRHYTTHPSGIECIEVVEHMPYCVGAAIKYLWRHGKKGDAVEDLKKARWLIDREISRLSKNEAG